MLRIGILGGCIFLLAQNWGNISSAFKSVLQAEPSVIDASVITDNEAASLELPSLTRSSTGVVRHVIKRGETLSTIVKSYGLDWAVVQKVSDALKQASESKKSYKLYPGQALEFSLDSKLGLVGLTLELGIGSYIKGERNAETGEFDVSLVELPRHTEEVAAHGVIESSFASAAASSGVSYDIVDELVDLYGSRVLFHRDFRAGDRFTLVYDRTELEDGTFVEGGPLKAGLLTVNGNQIAAVRFVGTDGKARYFDQDGEVLGNTFLRYPLRFSRISSVFTDNRFHPVLKRNKPHYGVDFAAPTGTPVRAAADGKVIFAGWKGANGKLIKIQHGSRYQTAYAHLHRISKGIKRGTRVTRGQVIGAVGTTGRSTGPHLHYAFYDRGRYVDPLKVKLPTAEQLHKGTQIPKPYLNRALGTLQHYHVAKGDTDKAAKPSKL
jgi:murein DD-endopeptidase MepM/ murein hydrolase activator NlpD